MASGAFRRIVGHPADVLVSLGYQRPRLVYIRLQSVKVRRHKRSEISQTAQRLRVYVASDTDSYYASIPSLSQYLLERPYRRSILTVRHYYHKRIGNEFVAYRIYKSIQSVVYRAVEISRRRSESYAVYSRYKFGFIESKVFDHRYVSGERINCDRLIVAFVIDYRLDGVF
ncbi:MAG: hypothetical protein BWX91_02593 [Spirochaetes bacterium ADurb.Bin133]|nr:MAG: hypothetical protein BWX91_02593 [Spirochaetes bacterium ADurb.Bin133]